MKAIRRICIWSWFVTLSLQAFAAVSGNTGAKELKFDDWFADSTLRIDYQFGGNVSSQQVMLDKQLKSSGWYGRRLKLNELPLTGNGNITVTDKATGDTIYRNSFSSLFQEWLSTDEALTIKRSMPNTFLVPLPKRAAVISIELLNARHEPIAAMKHVYRPDDELVEVVGESSLPYRYLHRGGDPKEVIDVAILAEGYTEEEMDSFYVYAEKAVSAMLNHEPFKAMADRFNFVAVASPSAESGVSIPRKGDWKQTAFGSHFSTFYSDRYLTTDRLPQVHDALRGIPYEHIIILANTPEYGGGGIFNSYVMSSAKHPAMPPVIVHEFGHSFGGLGDEYFYEGDVMEDSYPTDVEPWEPNLTTLVDFGSKWENLIEQGTPIPTPVADAKRYATGVFEGGGYSAKGVYRPADECRMRNNTYPTFCRVCDAAIRNLILFYTEP
ncbi:MAG: peptidase M64 [Paramuribaculum sp.]|nr:peptidase M64 [Paramuribaculum sp.]